MATIVNRNDIILQATSPRVDDIAPAIVDYSDLTDNLGIQPDDNADVTLVNTAANVTDQTGFATLAKINSGNVGTYIDNLAIKNAQIATAAIGTANIIDANVSTLKIKGQAVTIPVFSFSSTASTVSTSWKTLVTASITVSGDAPVRILSLSNCNASKINGSYITAFTLYRVRVLRGGTVIFSGNAAYDSMLNVIQISYSDNPPAGTYSYSFQVKRVAGIDMLAWDRSIYIEETKR